MEVKPEKSTRIISEILGMPAGISISWENSLPFRAILKVVEISKDHDFVERTIIFKTLPIL